MHSLKNSVRATSRITGSSPSPTFSITRRLRTQTSDGDQRPPESHALDRKDQPTNTLDPQAQSAQGSTHASRDERPAYVHGQASKGDPTGGARIEGTEQETAAPSLWASLKQKLGFGASTPETKHGSQSGNR